MMKKNIFFSSIIILFGLSHFLKGQDLKSDLSGAWKSDKGVIVFSGNFFSYADFDDESKEFTGTYGGSWSFSENELHQLLEFNTFNSNLVGQTLKKMIQIQSNDILIDDVPFKRIDDGSPGKLQGAWLFSGRKRDGETTSRDTSQPRKTMKILSGKRFQWIAYNTETGEFSGTGGGTYTTIDNKYSENIDFFSRDASRVGAILTFDYEIIGTTWHHSGLNSRGEPLYELWSLR